MSKLFDENGNEVEAFTKEELDAEIEKFKKEEEDADAKKKEEEAAAAKAKEEEENKQKAETEKTEVEKMNERLSRIEAENKQLKVEKLADQFAGNDAEKRKIFMAKFDRLTGYEETGDGLIERATDAAKLAFGEDAGIDTTTLGNAGGRNPGDVKQVQTTQADKDIQSALGISEDDVKKYGGEENKK